MMMPRPLHLMIGAGVVLAAANYLIASHPPSSAPIPAALSTGGDAGKAAAEAQPFVLPEGVQLTQALEKPVFSETRRPWLEPAMPPPPPVEVSAAPAPPAAQIGVALMGINRISGRSQALLLKHGEAEPRWVGSGETLDGWTLAEIGKNSVKLTAGAESMTFELYVQPPQGPVQ